MTFVRSAMLWLLPKSEYTRINIQT